MREVDASPSLAVGLAVCDVNREPSTNDLITHLSSLVPFVTFTKRDYTTLSERSVIPGARFSYLAHDNERLDYVFCLNSAKSFVKAYHNSSKFYLVVQDDALAEPGSLNYLWSIRDRISTFFGLKLHFPPKWQGFSVESNTFVEIILVAVISGGLTTVTCVTAFWLFGLRFGLNSKVSFALFGLTGTIVCFILGRQHSVLALKELVRFNRVGWFHHRSDCCIPAVVYPERSVNLIVDGMRNVTCSKSNPFDVALARLANDEFGRGSFPFLEPNLFEHVGRISTLSEAKSDLDFYKL